jgi:hypothetical protein
MTAPTDYETKVKALEQEKPDYWRLLYPKIYEHSPKCGQYGSPKDPVHHYLMELYKETQDWEERAIAEAMGLEERPSEYRPAGMISVVLMDYGMPMMWLSPSIAEAIQKTDPRRDLDWTTMKLPFPGMTFMLPGEH